MVTLDCPIMSQITITIERDIIQDIILEAEKMKFIIVMNIHQKVNKKYHLTQKRITSRGRELKPISN